MKLEDLPGDACAVCGGEMWHRKRVWALYCSRQCLNAYHNGLIAAARAEARTGRKCAWCDLLFNAVRSDQAYCSVRCQGQHYNARRRHERRRR